MKRIAALVLFVVVCAIGFLLLGSRKAEGPAEGGSLVAAKGGREGKKGGGKGGQPMPVLAAQAVRRDIRQVLDVTGSLRTDQDVQVGARLEGKVVRVTVKEGDRVQAGQVLVQLDERELHAQMAQARGLLEAAQAKLSSAQNTATVKDTTAKSDYDRAVANLDAAKTRVQQAKTNEGLVDVETKTRVQTAQSALTAAEQRLKITKEFTRDQELRQAQLAVEQAKANHGQALVDMDNARQVYDRRVKLYKQDAIAKEDVDEAERHFKQMEATAKVAQSAVSVAQERLSLAKEGSRPEEVRVAEEGVRQAQQGLDQAKSDVRRLQVAKDDVSAAESAQAQADAAVSAAKSGLIQPKLSLDDIRNAQATVNQARADIQLYQTRLVDMTIRAPVSGVVSTLNVHAGETVTNNSKLMNLVALDTVYFEAVVPELEVGLLRPGSAAQVTIDSIPGKKFPGTVREVIPVADAASKNYRVRVAVLGGGSRLPANGFARATVDVGTKRDAVALTRDAISTEGGDKYVWLIQDGDKGGTTVKRQTIEAGAVDGSFIQILSGLKAGDQVVASGSPAIVDGTPVQVTGSWKSLPTPNGPPGSVPFGDSSLPKEEGGKHGGKHGHHGGAAPVTSAP